MNTHVIKIGGENASDTRTAEWLADFQSQGNQVAVAISALRTKPLNTTTELMKARDAFNTNGMVSALPILERLFKVHLDTFKDAGMYDTKLEEHLRSLFEVYFPSSLIFPEPAGQYSQDSRSLDNLNTVNLPFGMRLPTQSVKQDISTAQEQRFIGYGEVMSAHILTHLLQTRYQVATTLLTDMTQGDLSEKNLSNILRTSIGRKVSEHIGSSLVVVPGYVGVSGHEFLPAYGRGYTDKVAERIAVGLADLGYSPTLHIQKQVPMYSSHPGNIPTVQVLQGISYRSAAEITGSRGANAQVLNEHTITDDLASKGIPVWVYNPFDKDPPRTVISAKGSSEVGVQFIDGRDHVSTITISSLNMLDHGILESVSDVLAQRSLSIDSISSSGTEITITTYKHLDATDESELLQELNRLGSGRYTANIKNNLGLIYCIGDNLAGHPGLLEKIAGTLAQADIDIECASQSRGQRAVTIGVGAENLARGIQLLHDTLITPKN